MGVVLHSGSVLLILIGSRSLRQNSCTGFPLLLNPDGLASCFIIVLSLFLAFLLIFWMVCVVFIRF